MALLDTTLLTNLTTAIGKAYVSYINSLGGMREDDDGSEGGVYLWLELCKSIVAGGNSLQTGIASGSTLTVTSNSNATVNVTGGNVVINGQTVAVSTNAAYANTTGFGQTCTDGSALTTGQFYYAGLVADAAGNLSVIRGPREDRPGAPDSYPHIPSGYCRLAWITVNYSATTTTIASGDIAAGTSLATFSAPSNNAVARMFNDFDTGQQKLISKTAVRTELGFALTSLNTYIKTVTGPTGDALNGGAGFTSIQQWAKSTHQTGSPWDFPTHFIAFYRAIKGGKDPSQRLATINFTGSGTATVTNLKKVVGFQDKFELVVTSGGSTGTAPSTVSVTVQSAGDSTAKIYTANVPASQANGTVIPMTLSGTTALQTPVVGTAQNTAITNSTVLATAPSVSTTPYTALVPTSPVTVVGGTSGDNFALRNTGVL